MRPIPARLLILLLIAPVAATAAQVSGDLPEKAAAAPGPSLSAEAKAFAEAAATGEPVELTGMRDEYTQTFATPDGSTLLQETSSSPRFGRNLDGDLVPVDTNLVRLPSGDLRPQAAAVDILFPRAGGSQLSIADHGRRLSLGLPGRLAAPTIDGPTATYSEVYPGVDLKLTAESSGFSQVWVVKTRRAAQQGSLNRLDMPASGVRGRLIPRAGGGSAFVDDRGSVVFASAPALMWDSSGDVAESAKAPTSRASRAEPLTQAAESPSEEDLVAEMPVTVSAGQLRVRPDQQMLDDPATTFPVFIDPMQRSDRKEWTMLRSDGYSDWQFPDDEGVGRCPTSYTNQCAGPYKKRVYYEFGRGYLDNGDKLLKAEFAAVQRFAMSCTPTPVELWQTDPISATSKWPGPAWTRKLGSKSTANGNGPSCPSDWVEFSNPTLLDAAQDLATGGQSRLAVMLKAGNEDDQWGWKRFDQSGVFRVWYVRKPGIPTSPLVHSATGDSCRDYDAPTVTDWDMPTFTARVQTLNPPGTDSEGQPLPAGSLRAKFDVEKFSSGSWASVGAGTWLRPAAGEPWVPDGTQVTLKFSDLGVRLQEGVMHRMRVLTQSYYDIAGIGSDTLESAWSTQQPVGGGELLGWCYFWVDKDAPGRPRILDDNGNPGGVYGLYPEEVDGVITWGNENWQKEWFKYYPHEDDNDPNVKSYTTTLIGNGELERYTNSSKVTPKTFGRFELQVQAKDIFDRHSTVKHYTFWVPAKPEEYGLWHVTSADTTASVADTNPESRKNASVPTRPLALSSGASITTQEGMGLRGNLPEDRALWFNGEAAAKAKTSTPAVNTETAFSVAAWVMPTATTRDGVVASQFSADGSKGMDLRYSSSAGGWSLGWTYTKDGERRTVRATAPGTAVNGAWTHVLGVYDPKDARLLLYVNGREVMTAWVGGDHALSATDGDFVVGNAVVNGAASTSFTGYIDEIRVWHRVASAQEAQERAAVHRLVDDPNHADFGKAEPYLSQVGVWRAALADANGLIDQSGFGREALKLVGSAELDPANALVHLRAADAALGVAGPVLDETASFTVTAGVKVDAAGLATKPDGAYRIAGQKGTVANGFSSWGLWFDKVGTRDGAAWGYWRFGRWSAPGSGQDPKVTEAIDEGVTATIGQVTQVTAVYDAEVGELRVFQGDDMVGAIRHGVAPYSEPSQGAGELSVGRAAASGGWSEWLTAGSFESLRVWVGAMTDSQVAAENTKESNQ